MLLFQACSDESTPLDSTSHLSNSSSTVVNNTKGDVTVTPHSTNTIVFAAKVKSTPVSVKNISSSSRKTQALAINKAAISTVAVESFPIQSVKSYADCHKLDSQKIQQNIKYYNDGQISAYSTNTYNRAQSLKREINYTSPGKDGNWFTSCDVVASYTQSYYQTHKLKKVIFYSGAGIDNKWFTDDDEISLYKVFGYDAIGRLSNVKNYDRQKIKLTETTMEQATQTEGDNPSNYIPYDYAIDGRLNSRQVYSSPGEDRNWFTLDDTLTRIESSDHLLAYHRQAEITDEPTEDYALTKEAHTASRHNGLVDATHSEHQKPEATEALPLQPILAIQKLEDSSNYSDKFFDGIEHPRLEMAKESMADDALDKVLTSIPNGNKVNCYPLSDQGSNTHNITYADDGQITTYTRRIYTQAQSLEREITYTSAGKDGDWFSSCDIAASYVQSYYQAHNLHKKITYTGMGDDDRWFTDDDEISSYKMFSYDALGRLSHEQIYQTKVITTAELRDRHQARQAEKAKTIEYALYDYSVDGSLSNKQIYNSPGEDHIWFTLDDTLSHIESSDHLLAYRDMAEKTDVSTIKRQQTQSSVLGIDFTQEINATVYLDQKTRGVRKSVGIKPGLSLNTFINNIGLQKQVRLI